MAVSCKIVDGIRAVINISLNKKNIAEDGVCANIHEDESEIFRYYWRFSEYPAHIDTAIFEFLVDCGRL